jgi:hypothetical protein
LLGWHPNNSSDALFSMNELIDQVCPFLFYYRFTLLLMHCFKFDIKDINHSGAVVDHQKLDWINKHHILKRAETPEGLNSLVDILKPFVNKTFYDRLKETKEAYRLENNYLSKVINTIKVMKKNITSSKMIMCLYFVLLIGTY